MLSLARGRWCVIFQLMSHKCEAVFQLKVLKEFVLIEQFFLICEFYILIESFLQKYFIEKAFNFFSSTDKFKIKLIVKYTF